MSEVLCPICGRPPEAKYLPFCSSRCSSEDLRRWLTGGYVLPPAEDDEPIPDGDDGD